jgi:hypothetical protein
MPIGGFAYFRLNKANLVATGLIEARRSAVPLRVVRSLYFRRKLYHCGVLPAS